MIAIWCSWWLVSAKQVIRYLKTTQDFALEYNYEEPFSGFSDSSWAEERDRKSVGCKLFKMSGAAITWRSTKQEVVALSSTEAEYIAVCDAAKEAAWLSEIQEEINPAENKKLITITFFEDQSKIKHVYNGTVLLIS